MGRVAAIPEAQKIEDLVAGVKGSFNQILKANIAEWNLNRENTWKQQEFRAHLRLALRNCGYGDGKAKAYVKEYMRDILQRDYGVQPMNIEKWIPFEHPEELSIQDKFEIMLYLYQKKEGPRALPVMIKKHGLDKANQKNGQPVYEITKRDIEDLYWTECVPIAYRDKLDILTQRVYQLYKGHGVIDSMLDQQIDGISSGVSEEITSIWIFFEGKTIHLSFLKFDSEKEFIRICKNIYRFDSPGHLSAARGYLANDRMDGSRVVVVRPPFSESWAFFVRKFDSIKKSQTEDLITDAGNDIPIRLIQWLIKGCQVIGITGSQGCGKTTLLMSLIRYINPAYTLRIQELTFELHLRKLYPERNIISFRETATVSGQEGLDILKKTDGSVIIVGEVASAPVASWLVEVSQVASLFTIFTHHAKTTEDLVVSLRNALLKTGGFSNEQMAAQQVVSAIRFDIHMNKDVEGHRYLERITEILPGSFGEFKTVDLVVWRSGRYQQVHEISRGVRTEILKFLTLEEKVKFVREMGMEDE